MSTYIRPPWTEPVFRDASGAVINYGSRWGNDGPPADSYSVTAHPERFAPLHLVADALIRHLVENYELQVSDNPANAADPRRRAKFLRVIRLTPADESAASLTFGFTAYPGVIVHAGLLHNFGFPVCGCDGCDETAERQVEQLEQDVLAVAAGHYREGYQPGELLPLSFSLSVDGRGQGGRSRAEGYPVEVLTEARMRLDGLRDGWAAWPPRSSDRKAALEYARINRAR